MVDIIDIEETSVRGAFTVTAEEGDYGKRLDFFIAEKSGEVTRSLASTLIRNEMVQVDGTRRKSGYKVKPGETVSVILPRPEEPTFVPEDIEIEILYEDSHLVVLNKRAGVVVHPAPGHYSGTLVNGLLYHCPDIEGTGCDLRPGIVHRLDKDTSGAMVVAKNLSCLNALSAMFKERTVYKKYTAIVYGDVKADSGIIDLPVGRHPRDRKRMSTHSHSGKPAETHYSINRRYSGASRLDFVLKTGRTHQIRVHCLSMGHPIVGDPVYTTKRRVRGMPEMPPCSRASIDRCSIRKPLPSPIR